MIDLDQAKVIAQAILLKEDCNNPDLVVMDDATIETDVGWVFFYNSKRYLNTGNILYALIGNIPLLIDKQNGSGYFISTDETIESFVEKYKSQRFLR